MAADEEMVIRGYANWHLPAFGERSTGLAIGFMIAGGLLIVLVDRAGRVKETQGGGNG